MLPVKLHLEQINRFHKTMKELREKIESETDVEKKGQLCIQYFHLENLGVKIDDFIEFILKQELDNIENET